MDFLVHFFRDILDGPLYWIMVGICFFLILLILGFLIDRHEKGEKLRGLVESSPSGKERLYVTDEMTRVEDVATPIPAQPTQTASNLNQDANKSVGVLELSSDDYQENSEVLQDSNNNL